ncbi:MAG: hypothetical protein A3B74_04015 [Candidatus Kerfeldbacteria bacterium RIFCSPHIGHO2_02_FULL_42_14]|uniref:Large ribosomal subunit protein bL25 n=1 Tax=Candidatus Kerfeldbacteria bacterium RIFCSPHIGHO2_02_FULL_42_14 TaxID=1798540 RepID=A0A1G2AQ52_9BACT|nr:MAG: hypothetical protein A3B74_04015 [Candidatus Kerfeldbacteria bacterium RIFCSPHIGHO2_02_FULL_42_14]OGY80675.1 MAG: hypothetical protein A3E60_04510 [Candidatus Kerfeldbacteria bacterium RIFCSPHIGHO2_12_FULL_42_13]OGY82602.1 MAG: hypothetical protein A3I91_04175 [Candidatus Kerfeldbacteria bacterium RIFCSPLOWO2_02_FULL_42_19]OGY85205.1 MAG: hypothetical protein A3G01_01305 [Candidatus Kerfeldbacteria bacterium RIFCSPLOWO2_12_FULL_43_9]
MKILHIQAQERIEFGKKTIKLRKNGLIPAILYGHGIKNRSMSIPAIHFKKIYEKAGENTLIDLMIEKEPPQKVIIHDVQSDPLTGQWLHVDFYQVRMDEKITTEIPLKFIGESPIVKEQNAILIKVKDALHIECLPNDLIAEINVDLSQLKALEDHVRIKDVTVPKTIRILDDPEESIVLTTAQKVEEAQPTPTAQEIAPTQTPEETAKKETHE